VSISINVTPAASGGTFTVGSTSSQTVTLEVTGGIGPPGTDVALAAGTGISIVTVNNTATISSTVVIPDNLADLSDVTLGNVTTGQVLAYNGTAWTAAADAALTLSTSAGSDLGTAAIGTSGEAARADHVHNLPTFAEITNGTATVTGNLTLNASTGSVTFNGGTAGSGSLTLNCEQNTHGVTIQSPPHSAGATYTLTLPTSGGAANQVLQTDGSGSLSWANQSAGSGGITWATEPAASNSTGNAGDIAYGSGYFYLHDGTEWRRAALSTFGVAATYRLRTETGDTLTTESGDYFDTSVPATITITAQPQNATASGGTASFSVTATVDDSSTLSYQWQEFTGAIWADITGGTSSTLSLGGLTSSDNGDQYRVQVSSSTAATVTSDTAVLTVSTVSSWTQYGSDIDGGAAGNDLGPVALNSNGTVMVVGEPGYNIGGYTDHGRMKVYADNGTAWVQRGADMQVGFQNALFGRLVDISDDGLSVIAAQTVDANSFPRRFIFTAGSWTQYPSSAYQPSLINNVGAIAISGDGNVIIYMTTAYAGGTSPEAPQAAAYDVSGGSYSQIGSNIMNSGFSGSLAVYPVVLGYGDCALNYDGTVAAFGNGWHAQVSGYDTSSHLSAVAVFEWTGTSWAVRGSNLYTTPNSYIYHSIRGSDHDDGFGFSVSLTSNGNRLAVGAPYGDAGGADRGYVRVYDWSGTAWSQVGGDITGVNNYDYAGWSVDISSDGSRVVVGLRGADGNGSNSGTTRIYDYSGTAWVQVGGDIEGSAGNDYSGSFVTISGDGTRVGIGAPGNDDIGADAGQVRVFEAS
jgi:hypothetical protein